MIYNLSDSEFQFLRVFCEIPRLVGFEDLLEPDSIGDPKEIVSGLKQKNYLNQDEEGKYYLAEELTFFLMVAKKADTAFTISGQDKSFSAYFKKDSIVLITTDQICQILWLPFLPLLIGAVADFLKPFLNTETAPIKTCAPEDLSATQEDLLQSGYEKKWEISFFENGDTYQDLMFEIYADTSRQILVQREKNRVSVSAPNKEDCVNAITRVIARLYADSIQREEAV